MYTHFSPTPDKFWGLGLPKAQQWPSRYWSVLLTSRSWNCFGHSRKNYHLLISSHQTNVKGATTGTSWNNAGQLFGTGGMILEEGTQLIAPHGWTSGAQIFTALDSTNAKAGSEMMSLIPPFSSGRAKLWIILTFIFLWLFGKQKSLADFSSLWQSEIMLIMVRRWCWDKSVEIEEEAHNWNLGIHVNHSLLFWSSCCEVS